jgi:hypothetical protein
MKEQLAIRYTNVQLQKILNEAIIYMCACPAQVAEQLLQLRKVFDYQNSCISKGSLLAEVHIRIAEATRVAHAEMERCLGDVLKMEGWDPVTLVMPEGLRELRQKLIDQDQ